MKRLFILFMLVVAGLFMVGQDLTWQSSPDISFVGRAEAIVGAPLTPVSVAGVARRTTRRVVATEATVATTAATSASAASKSSAPPPSTVVVVTSPPPAAPTATAVPIGTVMPALPAGCTSITVGGVNYSDCGGVFYKAAFQGNNLVYVVVEKPFK